jgi:hypothetical protein
MIRKLFLAPFPGWITPCLRARKVARRRSCSWVLSANLLSCFRYPPKHIPGLHITIHTTATQDREARMLLGAVGVPFTGKLIN